jgi:hypothetical protein
VSAGALLDMATRTCGPIDWRDRSKGASLSIFFLTTLDSASGLITTFMDAAARVGIEQRSIGIYIQPVVQNHGCHVELICPYDPFREEEVQLIRKMEMESVARVAQEGAFFSRPYGSACEVVFRQNPMSLEVLRKVKGIFDPNQVLNHGKWGL